VLIITIIFIASGVYLGLHVGYYLFLLLANFAIRAKTNPALPFKTRIGVIIPAHNEEMLLPRLLRNLENQDYPRALFNVIVVADNCTDETGRLASAFGAKVLERHDSERIGKGYAIKYALDNLQMDRYDAVFIVDADSVLGRGALGNLNQVFQGGATIIQCYNGVANPDDSWLTRLLDVSRTLSNEIFEPAKEKLGLSSHLMGNGMGIAKEVIERYGWTAFTVGEDWEYYAQVIRAGKRVAFAREVRVYHQESRTLKQATPQRMRWSSGRMAVAWRYGLRILGEGLRKGDLRIIDASFPLLLPNPSMGVNLNGLLIFFSSLFQQPNFAYFFTLILGLHLSIFMIGIGHTKKRLRNLSALFMAPIFLTWKLVIDFFSLAGFGRTTWVRTKRKG
jgi:cellulose synthase/poly-beta-1,6-N-acetylglucosamine synthase-like glycosyltransferase